MPTDLQPLIDRVAETLVFRSYAERDEAVRIVKDAFNRGHLFSYNGGRRWGEGTPECYANCTIMQPEFQTEAWGFGSRVLNGWLEQLSDSCPHDHKTGRITDCEPLVRAFMACRVEGA